MGRDSNVHAELRATPGGRRCDPPPARKPDAASVSTNPAAARGMWNTAAAAPIHTRGALARCNPGRASVEKFKRAFHLRFRQSRARRLAAVRDTRAGG
ncbi:hypothetical protein DM992_29970 [Burkholderia sp. JP2-270]|nr:hypothetical protein DM992_29970 [Burkholderia sp. JP2-270]